MVAGGRTTAGSQIGAPIDPGGVARAQPWPPGSTADHDGRQHSGFSRGDAEDAEKASTGGPPAPPFWVPKDQGRLETTACTRR